jgi:WD40 repeat protein
MCAIVLIWCNLLPVVSPATDTVVSPTGDRIYTLGPERQVRAWTTDYTLVWTSASLSVPVYVLACAPAGDELAVAGAEGTIVHLDAATGQVRHETPCPIETVYALAYRASGHLLAGGHAGRVVELDGPTVVRQLDAHLASVVSLAVSASGLVSVADRAGLVVVWEWDTQTPVWSQRVPGQIATLTPHAGRLAIGTHAGTTQMIALPRTAR